MSTWKAGQVVYVVSHYCGAYESTILKVGRKWATLPDGNRFDLAEGKIDGGNHSSLGQVWLNRDEHDAHVRREQCWRAFQRCVSMTYKPPAKAGENEITIAGRNLFGEEFDRALVSLAQADHKKRRR